MRDRPDERDQLRLDGIASRDVLDPAGSEVRVTKREAMAFVGFRVSYKNDSVTLTVMQAVPPNR